jgi:TolB-like protein/tetratricopeptide (TPR) repeat protein
VTDSLDRLQAALSGRYAVVREIGEGGTATVYLARDEKHDRMVAIKLLRAELAGTLGPERFLREIRVTAALQHPHILPLLDSGTADGLGGARPYYVMPFVEGEALRGRLTREQQLPVDQAVRIAREVATALEYAHARGVVHRDIKPENVLLSAGHAVVADFGIARALSAGGERLTATGLAVGTPSYMSPEQATGDGEVDGRADIYALGCVLFEMLTGEPPFTGRNVQAIIARRLVEPAPAVRTIRETVPEGVERAIARALARSPADRFRTAGAFADALAKGMARASRPAQRPGAGWRFVGMAGLVLGAAGIIALFHTWPTSSRGGLTPSGSLIAVLPFSPSGQDSALSRLGRDLVFTVTAELDGLGGIRVVDPHTVLAHARPGDLYTAASAAEQARRFGAGAVLRGSLVREGAAVLLDFALAPVDTTLPPLARGSVTGPPDSIAALSDSAVRALLRQAWTRGQAPTPSLEGALRTRSVPALRAFLEGEGQIIGGQWDVAAASYRRAMEADSTFWLAAARYLYCRSWSLQEADESVTEPLERHLAELPEQERLSTESLVLSSRDSIGLALDRAAQLTERYPSSWFGWLMYADQLFHAGPLLGHPESEARAGFERALALNPDLIPVHEHLMLLALRDRDTALSGLQLRELTRLDAWPILMMDGFGTRKLQFRYLDAMNRQDTALTRALTDSMARDPAPSASKQGSFYDPFRYGRGAEQIAISSQAIRLGVGPPARQVVHRRLVALSWAGRGAWDSALTAMDRLASSGLDRSAALRSYGLAVVASWLGAVDPRNAEQRRDAAASSATSDSDRAELLWLDGVLAMGRNDRRALAAARTGLERNPDPAAGVLGRSLAAFDTGLGGASRAAGEALAGLEWEQAAVNAGLYSGHPWVIGVNRLAGARWLAAAGTAADSTEALRLLTWVESPYFLHQSTIYSVMFAGLAELERGRIEDRRVNVEAARRHYEEFRRRYDRPMPSQQGIVDEVRSSLWRLTGN